MSGHSLRARLALALATGVMLLGAIAAPAGAVTVTTRWVDDDNKEGDGPKACDNANFSTIQGAINASNGWDRVFVCPGNYDEQLTIDVTGLEVRSVVALAAKLWPPETLVEEDGETTLVTIDAPYVTYRSFKINIQAGAGVAAVPSDCEFLDGVIWVRAPRAQVLGNHMKTLGTYTYMGECGYGVGIVVDDGTDNEFGPSMIWRNWIRDFKFAGILVLEDSAAKLFYNAIRFVHYNDPTTCQMVPVPGVVAADPTSIFPDCPLLIPVRGGFADPRQLNADVLPQQLNGLFEASVGILVEFAKVNAKGNSIYSQINTSLLEGSFLVTLIAGIVLLDPHDTSKLKVNRIDNVGVGVVIAEEEIVIPDPPARPPAAPDGVSVYGNRVSETIAAFVTVASDGVYVANRAHLNLLGMLVLDGEDNVFARNDFRFNEIDCDDETAGSGTLGTANDWEDINLGFEDSPDGLCLDFFITPI